MSAAALPALTGVAPSQEKADLAIADFCADTYADPLAFVLGAYPWGRPGALERHAAGPDRWQREFLEGIGAEVARNGFDGSLPVSPIRRAVSSGHGIGKAQPVSLMLHTPAGLQRWGDIQVGDYVFGADGRPTKVIAVHGRGTLPVYRVTFDDRSSTRATADHVWTVRGRAERRNGSPEWRTLTTAALLDQGARRRNGKASARQWEIPAQGAAQFSARSLPINPYLLGVWLGDGGRMSGLITSADDEAMAHIAACGDETRRRHGLSWRIPGLRKKLRELGILDRYSYQKSVPAPYLEASVADRAELLRGLLDTDGECTRGGVVVFNSTSRALAEDVVWLARSLGGKATIQPTTKKPVFTDGTGNPKAGLPCWRATVTMPDGFRCFYITRKQARIPGHREARYLARWIDSIEPEGEEESRCITVEAPDGLYQTNDFIVTHNSAMSAWLVDWIMSTRPHSQGTITANTFTQLETKTWAAVQFWTKLCITAQWFDVTATRMFHKLHKESWFCSPQSCRDENSEAFAGQHAQRSTSFYIFDEDSAVGDAVHEVAEGGLTDGEPMVFLFGNPTRNSGHFHRACFGAMRDRWTTTVVDSRQSRFTNKTQIEEWIHDYGEESDFVRVRVRGLPPLASELQFIGYDVIQAAQGRPVPPEVGAPLVCGVDVSDGGAAWNVIRFRRGSDARSTQPIRIPGEVVRMGRETLLAKLADVLDSEYFGQRVVAMFIDSAFGAPYVERLKSMGYRNVYEVRFGGPSPDERQLNMRAFMWSAMRDWLRAAGAIDPHDGRLADDLAGPGYHLTSADKLVLESKEDMAKRGVASPDDADALALTFAARVAGERNTAVRNRGGYMPLPTEFTWS